MSATFLLISKHALVASHTDLHTKTTCHLGQICCDTVLVFCATAQVLQDAWNKQAHGDDPHGQN